jgi:predicted nucleic acid-binding protein
MKERVFVDTNVLVYLFDADDPAKQRIVQNLSPRLRRSAV